MSVQASTMSHRVIWPAPCEEDNYPAQILIETVDQPSGKPWLSRRKVDRSVMDISNIKGATALTPKAPARKEPDQKGTAHRAPTEQLPVNH